MKLLNIGRGTDKNCERLERIIDRATKAISNATFADSLIVFHLHFSARDFLHTWRLFAYANRNSFAARANEDGEPMGFSAHCFLLVQRLGHVAFIVIRPRAFSRLSSTDPAA